MNFNIIASILKMNILLCRERCQLFFRPYTDAITFRNNVMHASRENAGPIERGE